MKSAQLLGLLSQGSEETQAARLEGLIGRLAAQNALPQLFTALPEIVGKSLAAWHLLRHPHQCPPRSADWTTWLILGGRGAGKTRAGAEWVRTLVEQHCVKRIALVGETFDNVREVMIEGESGLVNIAPGRTRPEYISSRRRLVWPNGAVAYSFSSADPDGLRGFQFEAAWADELCKWTYPEDTWSNLQLTLRLGTRPRQVVTTTPRPIALLRRLMKSTQTKLSNATTYENRANLADAFLTEIAAVYEGTRLGRQELMGEVIEAAQGAAWTWSMIEAARIGAAPLLDEVVIGVDPPVTSGPRADECGIIVAGTTLCGGEKTTFVIADLSLSGATPAEWGRQVIEAWRRFDASRIVVEVNQGGEMVTAILAQIDPRAPVRPVRAIRAKLARARVVAMLYERGLVRHVGAFAKLEDQMTSFTGEGGASPDRMDALVWALSDLMLAENGYSEPRIWMP